MISTQINRARECQNYAAIASALIILVGCCSFGVGISQNQRIPRQISSAIGFLSFCSAFAVRRVLRINQEYLESITDLLEETELENTHASFQSSRYDNPNIRNAQSPEEDRIHRFYIDV